MYYSNCSDNIFFVKITQLFKENMPFSKAVILSFLALHLLMSESVRSENHRLIS